MLAGCGGSQNPPTTQPEPAVEPPRFTVQPSLDPPEVEVILGEPLQEAFARVNQAFQRENIRPFDAHLAYGTSAAHDFAWYLTLNDSQDELQRTNHVFFVVSQPWEPEQTYAFLLSYLVMPAAPASDAGRPWFHFYSAERPPLAVRFMFSNTALGALEAAILTELGTTGWLAENAPQIADSVITLLERFGLASPSQFAATCPEVLDRIYAGLPRPDEDDPPDQFGRDYLPQGILAAIGLLVGESIRTATAGATAWAPDDLSEIYPRLEVTGMNEGILRPIPMITELFAAGTDVLPSAYCERMIETLRQ